MKKSLYACRLLAILAFSMIAVSALGQNAPGSGQNPLFRHLPPNAQDIYHINLPVLTSKVGRAELIGKLPFLQKPGDKDKELELLKDPPAPGIVVNQDIFFAQPNHGGTDRTALPTGLLLPKHSLKFV